MLWPLPHLWPPFQTCFLSVPSWAIYSTSLGHSSFVYKIQRISTISKGDNVCKSSASIVRGTRQTKRNTEDGDNHENWVASAPFFSIYSELSSHFSQGWGPSFHGATLAHNSWPCIPKPPSESPVPQGFQRDEPSWREDEGLSTQPDNSHGTPGCCFLALFPLGFLPSGCQGDPSCIILTGPWGRAVISVPQSHLLFLAMSNSLERLIDC